MYWERAGEERSRLVTPEHAPPRVFFFLSFYLFRAAPAAHEGSQARGPIGAPAAGLHHSHSHRGSEPRLRPAPQRMATLDPQPPEPLGNSPSHTFPSTEFPTAPHLKSWLRATSARKALPCRLSHLPKPAPRPLLTRPPRQVHPPLRVLRSRLGDLTASGPPRGLYCLTCDRHRPPPRETATE